MTRVCVVQRQHREDICRSRVFWQRGMYTTALLTFTIGASIGIALAFPSSQRKGIPGTNCCTQRLNTNVYPSSALEQQSVLNTFLCRPPPSALPPRSPAAAAPGLAHIRADRAAAPSRPSPLNRATLSTPAPAASPASPDVTGQRHGPVTDRRYVGVGRLRAPVSAAAAPADPPQTGRAARNSRHSAAHSRLRLSASAGRHQH